MTSVIASLLSALNDDWPGLLKFQCTATMTMRCYQIYLLIASLLSALNGDWPGIPFQCTIMTMIRFDAITLHLNRMAGGEPLHVPDRQGPLRRDLPQPARQAPPQPAVRTCLASFMSDHIYVCIYVYIVCPVSRVVDCWPGASSTSGTHALVMSHTCVGPHNRRAFRRRPPTNTYTPTPHTNPTTAAPRRTTGRRP